MFGVVPFLRYSLSVRIGAETCRVRRCGALLALGWRQRYGPRFTEGGTLTFDTGCAGVYMVQRPLDAPRVDVGRGVYCRH